jgi:predicted lactoylglutathione lyase
MFQRGRLDHFALNAASEDAFRELRRRVVAAWASNGVVTDMGSLLIFTLNDADGGAHEVVWMKPDTPVGATLKRSEWTSVTME